MISCSICLFLSDISLSIILSRSIHVAENGMISSLLMAEYYSIVCMYFIYMYKIYVYMHIYAINICIHIYIYYTHHSFFFPFICRWALELFLCLGYCK